MMLGILPNEITFRIASYLDMYEKLNVIKTCRKLKAILSEILFEELTIPRQKTNVMIEKFGKGQYDGSHVKRLIFYIETIHPKVFSKLPIIFPNITELKQISHPYNFPSVGSESQVLFENWKDTLKRYDMSENSCGIIPSLLSFSFSRLVHLELLPTYNTSIRQFTFSDVIRCVEHAPSLKTLVLRYFHINIACLEEIHSKTSTLQSLVLASGVIDFNSAILPQPILPCTNLQTFRVGYSTDIYDKRMSDESNIGVEGASNDKMYKEQMSACLSYLVPRLKNLTIIIIIMWNKLSFKETLLNIDGKLNTVTIDRENEPHLIE
ncbi:hypothetical protein K501DRAFT_269001 [Backusella circina FSU 941]|nr:hypothetical protein K501DRAFT_269001 [Backusella circina FSU 941]